MKLVYATILTLGLFCLVSCSKHHAIGSVVNISLENKSSHALDWVRLEWEGPDVAGGAIPPGSPATTIGVEWPDLESVTITFVDEASRARYNIAVTLTSVNQQVLSGECQHVIFQILDYDKAEVVCE